MSDTLLKTPLHAWHAAHGGRLVPFGGWEMPVQYTTIVAEHQAVRQRAGLFDISHMGRLRFTGPGAAAFLDAITTNNVAALDVGQVQYSLVCQESGGVLDDVLVYRFADFHLLVVNASNRPKILDWIARRRSGFDFQMEDLTASHGMLALQGPGALDLVRPHLDVDPASLKYYWATPARALGTPGLLSRTGYTGEDGVEVILPNDAAVRLWERLVADGATPAGLGSRDTLRLEAGMPLYGHELNEEIDPLTAGLGFAVKLDAADFCGRAALRTIRETGLTQRRVGLELAGKRIAREGTKIFADDRRIGQVTSGTFSPTLQRSIAMGYVACDAGRPSTPVALEIRGQREPATVVKLPFYKRG